MDTLVIYTVQEYRGIATDISSIVSGDTKELLLTGVERYHPSHICYAVKGTQRETGKQAW
jgi:hypothetical protein